MWRRIPLLLSCVLLFACGSTNGPNPFPQSSPYPSPSPSPAANACIKSGSASTNWPPAIDAPKDHAISNLNVAGRAITITFISGTPAYTITDQATSSFVLNPSGRTVTLKGTHGVLITLKGFRGDVSAYTGANVFNPPGPLLLQVQKLSDFEGTVQWGAGLSGPACVHVLSTPGGSSLTFEFVPA